MTRAARIVQRNALVYRHLWRSSLLMTFLQPTLFLGAMGFGLGSLVDRGGAALPGGISYLAFLAPGLLAATCMQTAGFESSFPICGKMTWQQNYDAIAASPMAVSDIVFGELAWIGLRLLMVATAFAVVMVLFGASRSPWLLVAIPAAVLTGLAFSAPIVAFAATLSRTDNFNWLFRFVITPLFLFSGVYFPITRLPGWLQTVALFTPLFHGVELTRGLLLGTLTWSSAAVHVAYLVALMAIGSAAAIATFTRQLRA